MFHINLLLATVRIHGMLLWKHEMFTLTYGQNLQTLCSLFTPQHTAYCNQRYLTNKCCDRHNSHKTFIDALWNLMKTAHRFISWNTHTQQAFPVVVHHCVEVPCVYKSLAKLIESKITVCVCRLARCVQCIYN